MKMKRITTGLAAGLALVSLGAAAQNSATEVSERIIPITYYLLNDSDEINTNTAPTVNWVTPNQNQEYTVGDTINVAANANDADGVVIKVDLRVGSEVVGSDSTPPYSWDSLTYSALSQLSAGTHSLNVVVTDNYGKTSAVATRNIRINALNVLPEVSFSLPAVTSVVEGTAVQVEVNASDADGSIASVQLLVDGVALRTERGAPYNWNKPGNPSSDALVLSTLSVGEHELTVIVTDNAGGQQTANQTITITPEVIDNVATIQLDFGQADSPADWNAVTGRSVNGLLTTDGEATSINFLRINATHFSGLNTNGTQTPEIDYPANVTQDGFASFNREFAEFKLTGLDLNKPYTLNIFGSTRAGTINYQTAYTVTGNASQTATLDTHGNISEQVTMVVQPSAAGEFTVRVAAGQDNSSAQGAFFINALTVNYSDNSTPVPVDSDGDGVVDSEDKFPNDPTETKDSDDDGVGDNADVFKNDSSETQDSDNDGIGDNADPTPYGELPDLPDSPEIATVTSGVAPLAVSFDAGAEGENFHNRLYEWNFGDATAGNWVGVEDRVGLPKNTDTGPVNGHLYTQPGTYIATLRVSDSSGEIPSLAKQVTITVEDPNEVFAGEKTKCVSIVGDFTGCPSGAERLTYNSVQLSDNLRKVQSQSRILFRRGDKWADVEIPGIAANYYLSDDLHFSAYGACELPDARGICSNAPIIESITNGKSLFLFANNAKNITMEHLHLSGTDRTRPSISIATIPRNFILNKLRMTVVEGFDPTEARGFTIVDSDLTGGHSVIVFVGGHDLIIKGNHIHDSYSSHLLRITSSYKSIIAHNVLHSVEVDPQRVSRLSQVLKFVGNDFDHRKPGQVTEDILIKLGETSTPSQYNVISNNYFGTGGDWSITISPVNSSRNESIKDVIFEKNVHACAYGNPATRGTVIPEDKPIRSDSCSRIMNIQAQDVTIRNNTFDLKKNVPDGTRAIFVDMYSTNSPAPENIKIYNNTINVDDVVSTGSHSVVRVEERATNIEIVNNLVKTPNISILGDIVDPRRKERITRQDGTSFETYTSIPLDPSKIYVDNNVMTENPGWIDGTNNDVLERNYRLLDSSPAVDAGVLLPEVIEDFSGALRSEGLMDVGAYAD